MRGTDALALMSAESPRQNHAKATLPLPEDLHGLHSTAPLRGDVDRRGGQRRMPQVLLGDLDGHSASDRMTGVRMPHPVRAGFLEALSSLCFALPSQNVGTARKKRLDLVVKRRRRNPVTRVKQLTRVQPGQGVFCGLCRRSARAGRCKGS